VKLGIIARSESRGLGIQTWEACRHLNPDRVLLVEPKPAGWIQHPDRYARFDTTQVQWYQGQLHETTVRSWLDGLDVVYTAESDYDRRMAGWCAEAGAALVRHVNPEQLAAQELRHAGRTVWWAATPWRLDHLPASTRVVPMPVAIERFRPAPRATGKVSFLHVVGHQAQDDRAGSRTVARSIEHIVRPCRLTVTCQNRRMDIGFNGTPTVEVDVQPRGIEDYWKLYKGHHVLIAPRRYGGLSLPTLEAAAAGMAIVMPDCSPNEGWPGMRLPVARRSTVLMRCGPVDVYDVHPETLAAAITNLASDPDLVAGMSVGARRWAETQSWEALTPLWIEEFDRAYQSSFPGTPPTSTASGPGDGSGPPTASAIPAGR